MERVSKVWLVITLAVCFLIYLHHILGFREAQNQCMHVEFSFLGNRRAQKEVEALSGLEHCNIVRYYTCWLEENRYEVESGAGSSSGS